MKSQRMSFKVFLKELRKLRGAFHLKGDLIRTVKRARYYDGVKLGGYMCPIEAVAQRLGEDISETSLPLQSRTRTRIIAAADGEYRRRIGWYRQQMLKVLKLEEV